nr:NAD-dependent epimerase/dehydratase family protein [Lysinibacillus timonensis]
MLGVVFIRVLVTGGAGFIGSHTIDLLLEENYEVIVVDVLTHGEYQLDAIVPCFKQPIEDFEMMYKIFEEFNPDIVLHLAAQVSVSKSIENPMKDAQTNIIGTINLLKLSHLFHVKKFIFSSSAAVYGVPIVLPISELHPTVPISYYGMSKLVAEEYIKMFSKIHGINFCTLRYANVFGPRQHVSQESGVITIFNENNRNGQPIVIFGSGEQTRDYVYVKDVARANVASIKFGNNETFNIGSGTSTSLLDMLEFIEVFRKSVTEKIWVDERAGDIKHSVLNVEKAKEQLFWNPQYTFKAGMEELLTDIVRVSKY